MSNTDNKVAEFLSDISSVSAEHADIINHVRSLFLNSDSSIDETINYGGLVFIKQGNLLGGIFSYQNHLSLEFSKGAELDDPHGVLEGKGKFAAILNLRPLTIFRSNIQVYISIIRSGIIKQTCHSKVQ